MRINLGFCESNILTIDYSFRLDFSDLAISIPINQRTTITAIIIRIFHDGIVIINNSYNSNNNMENKIIFIIVIIIIFIICN